MGWLTKVCGAGFCIFGALEIQREARKQYCNCNLTLYLKEGTIHVLEDHVTELPRLLRRERARALLK